MKLPKEGCGAAEGRWAEEDSYASSCAVPGGGGRRAGAGGQEESPEDGAGLSDAFPIVCSVV